MNDDLLIPKTLKIGFNQRSDTYTAKLGYVIYYDNEGVLKKEKSFNGWINNTIPVLDKEANKPTEGFVVNRNLDVHRSYSHFQRIEKVRVYDPRDFEIEITVENLLYIMQHCDCYKGKGIDGKFVYAWKNNTLVLLPTNSVEYQSSVEFTELQNANVKEEELKIGATYSNKNKKHLVYIGKFPYYYYSQNSKPSVKKVFVFWDEKRQKDSRPGLLTLDSLKTISCLKQETCHPNFAFFLQAYHNSFHSSKIVSVELKPTIKKVKEDGKRSNDHYQVDYENRYYSWFTKHPTKDNVFLQFCSRYDCHSDRSKSDGFNYTWSYILERKIPFLFFNKKRGILQEFIDEENKEENEHAKRSYFPRYSDYLHGQDKLRSIEQMDLWITLENGKEFILDNSYSDSSL